MNPETCSPLSSVLRPPSSLLWAAALAALFWAVHPLRVESVAWIASRKDVLSLFWELLALLFWVRGIDPQPAVLSPPASDSPPSSFILHPSSFYWLLSIFCFALAVMAKPMAITFVLLAGLLDLFLSGQVRWKRLEPVAWLTLPAVALSIYTQQAVMKGSLWTALPLWGRLLNALSAAGLYLKQTVWPERLMVPVMPRWPLQPEFFWPSVCCLSVLGGVIAWHVAAVLFRKADGPAEAAPTACGAGIDRIRAWLVFGLVGFFVSVLPTLGISAFGYQARADRFTYLPAVWLSVSLAGVLAAGFQRWGRRVCVWVVCAGVGWAGALALLACQQTMYWRDTETLSRRALAIDPNNLIAHKNLATYFFVNRVHLKEACEHMVRATDLYQDPTWYILGLTVLIDSGEREQARTLAARFIEEIKNKEACGWDVHYKIAYAYQAFCAGDKDVAREHFAVVAEKNPQFAPVQYMLGRLALERGDQEAVKRHWAVAARDPMFRDWLK